MFAVDASSILLFRPNDQSISPGWILCCCVWPQSRPICSPLVLNDDSGHLRKCVSLLKWVLIPLQINSFHFQLVIAQRPLSDKCPWRRWHVQMFTNYWRTVELGMRKVKFQMGLCSLYRQLGPLTPLYLAIIIQLTRPIYPHWKPASPNLPAF